MITQSRPYVGRWRTRALEVSGDGPVLLLLHGFGDHAGTWLPVLTELQQHGQRAVALDLPNFGEADPVGDGPMLESLHEFVAAAVEHWTEDGLPPVVVGNSLGGVMALRMGADPDIAVSGVVPVSPAGFGHVWFIEVLEKYSWINPLLFTPIVPMGLFRYLTANGFAWAAAGSSGVVKGVSRAMAVHFRSGADVKRIFGVAPTLLAEIRAWSSDLPALTAPCLILWGQGDRLTLIAGAEVLAAQVPHAEVVVLDDCGHCSQVGRPDLVAEHLARFAASVTAEEHVH
ncbi:MAG: alpha/beta fold hydrolase [Marmoricola sp.]